MIGVIAEKVVDGYGRSWKHKSVEDERKEFPLKRTES